MISGTPQLPCPVCKRELTVKLAHGRKSGKTSLMLVCPSDGRHFRGFIADRDYVSGVVNLLEERS